MTEYEVDVEPELLSSFEKYEETSLVLSALLSVSLFAEPSAEENRAEDDQLKCLTDIVINLSFTCRINPYSMRLMTYSFQNIKSSLIYSTLILKD